MNGSGRARGMTQAQVTRSTSQRPPPFTYLSQNRRYLGSEVFYESTHANLNFDLFSKNSSNRLPSILLQLWRTVGSIFFSFFAICRMNLSLSAFSTTLTHYFGAVDQKMQHGEDEDNGGFQTVKSRSVESGHSPLAVTFVESGHTRRV